MKSSSDPVDKIHNRKRRKRFNLSYNHFMKKNKKLARLLAVIISALFIIGIGCYAYFGQYLKSGLSIPAHTFVSPNKDLSINIPANWRTDLSGVSGFPLVLTTAANTPPGFQSAIPTMSLFVRPAIITLPTVVIDGKPSASNNATGTLSVIDYANSVKNDFIPVALKPFAKNYQLMEAGPVTLKDGTPAYLIDTEFDVDYSSIPTVKFPANAPAFLKIDKSDGEGIQHFHNYNLFAIKNNMLYIFTATANTADWNSLQGTFKNTLLSMQLK